MIGTITIEQQSQNAYRQQLDAIANNIDAIAKTYD